MVGLDPPRPGGQHALPQPVHRSAGARPVRRAHRRDRRPHRRDRWQVPARDRARRAHRPAQHLPPVAQRGVLRRRRGDPPRAHDRHREVQPAPDRDPAQGGPARQADRGHRGAEGHPRQRREPGRDRGAAPRRGGRRRRRRAVPPARPRGPVPDDRAGCPGVGSRALHRLGGRGPAGLDDRVGAAPGAAREARRAPPGGPRRDHRGAGATRPARRPRLARRRGTRGRRRGDGAGHTGGGPRGPRAGARGGHPRGDEPRRRRRPRRRPLRPVTRRDPRAHGDRRGRRGPGPPRVPRGLRRRDDDDGVRRGPQGAHGRGDDRAPAGAGAGRGDDLLRLRDRRGRPARRRAVAARPDRGPARRAHRRGDDRRAGRGRRARARRLRRRDHRPLQPARGPGRGRRGPARRHRHGRRRDRHRRARRVAPTAAARVRPRRARRRGRDGGAGRPGQQPVTIGRGLRAAVVAQRGRVVSRLPDVPLPRLRGRFRRRGLLAFLAVMGPGIIAGVAGNDAGGLTTYSVMGAQTGLTLLWIFPITIVILAIVQEMVARLGVVTGQGLSDLIRERFGVRWTVFAMAVLLVANVANTIANMAGAAAALDIFGVPKWLTVPVVAIAIWGLVLFASYRVMERVFLLVMLVFLAYPVAAILATPDWAPVGRAFITPTLALNPSTILLLVAVVGTTITPYMQFYLQSAVAEKGIGEEELRLEQADAIVGSVWTNVIAVFIVVATAAAVAVSGAATTITSATDAAQALEPVAGPFAQSLFGIGLFGASVLAATIMPLSTAFVICEAF